MCLLAFVIPCCGLAASHPDGPQKLSLNAGWHFVRLDSPTAGHATSYSPLISPPQVPAYRGEAVGGGSHGHTQPAVAATRTWRHRRPFGRRAYTNQATGVHRAGDGRTPSERRWLHAHRATARRPGETVLPLFNEKNTGRRQGERQKSATFAAVSPCHRPRAHPRTAFSIHLSPLSTSRYDTRKS